MSQSSKKVAEVVMFRRTRIGLAVYDIYFSHLSAAEVARRHKGVSRQFVLSERRTNPLRKQALEEEKNRGE